MFYRFTLCTGCVLSAFIKRILYCIVLLEKVTTTTTTTTTYFVSLAYFSRDHPRLPCYADSPTVFRRNFGDKRTVQDCFPSCHPNKCQYWNFTVMYDSYMAIKRSFPCSSNSIKLLVDCLKLILFSQQWLNWGEPSPLTWTTVSLAACRTPGCLCHKCYSWCNFFLLALKKSPAAT